MILSGALLCSSDTKIDQAGKSEEIVMAEESRTMMAVTSNFTSDVGSTQEVDQACIGDEVKNDNSKESSSTIVSSYKQSVDDVIDQIH